IGRLPLPGPSSPALQLRGRRRFPSEAYCFAAAELPVEACHAREVARRERDEAHTGGDRAHALAPVYDRKPTRQNSDERMKAAMDPTTRTARPKRSSLPEIACAGRVTATPTGTAVDSVTRSHPG